MSDPSPPPAPSQTKTRAAASTQPPDPPVDFDCDEFGRLLDAWVAFWGAARSWLAERGYTLYDHGDYIGDERYEGEVTFCAPRIPTTELSVQQHPFALFGGDSAESPCVPPLSAYPTRPIAYAQDSCHRHCALKLVKDSSAEYEIARYLSQELALQSLESFEGVLPPVDLLRLGSHWIIVMPRWGGMVTYPWFSSIREILDYMRYLLKGLSFLHKNHIVHRDIKAPNVLVNHFCAFPDTWENAVRKTLRAEGRLVYAITDFGLSIRFPASAAPAACRLPSNLSWDGGTNQPYDTRQGELDYDPFAFDVGCLGVHFCEEFQHLTRIVPLFAPLMDRMTTRELSSRFTASQALAFLEGFASRLTPEQLQTSSSRRDGHESYEEFDRWKHLPEDFVRDWAQFREPKPSCGIRLLRYVCDYDWGFAVVQWIRRAIRFGTNLSSDFWGTEMMFTKSRGHQS